MNIDIRKDAGPMGVSAQMIQNNIDVTAPLITKIFNSILKTGQVPTSWKTSFIVPIPKKGRHADIENYRGIALQSVIPKAFDKLLTDKLSLHTATLIPDEQHGFRQRRGTTTNLFEKTLFIHEHISAGTQVDIVYFDLSKAFDTINHRIIAKRLASVSTAITLFKTIMNFVIGRSYILKADGKQTNFKFSTESAVPQRSHLGPALFNLATSPLTTCTDGTNTKMLSYADDSKLLQAIKCQDDSSQLQTVIDRFVAWTSDNHFKINPTKCSHVTYLKSEAHRIRTRYYIQEHRIPEHTIINDLGVTFDSNLSFGEHIKRTHSRTLNMCHMAARYSNELHAPVVMGKIVKTYIEPIIEFNSPIWSHARPTLLRKLEDVLHRGTRITLNLPYRTTNPRYKDFQTRLQMSQLLSYDERRIIHSISFVLKIMKEEIDSNLKEESD